MIPSLAWAVKPAAHSRSGRRATRSFATVDPEDETDKAVVTRNLSPRYAVVVAIEVPMKRRAAADPALTAPSTPAPALIVGVTMPRGCTE